MQTFIKSNNSPKFHDAVKAGGASNKAVNNILRAGVKPKLKIGAVNDPAEVEADRVADQVMRMPAPVNYRPAISNGNSGDTIQRKCTECGDEEKIQRKETPDIRMKETGGAGGHTASAEASSAINSLGPGSPLPASERAFFEPRFGQDLSHIRVHTGGTADTASKTINARAFSLGNNVAFANGEYQPGTQSGRTLMAHEITHTLQGTNDIKRQDSGDSGESDSANPFPSSGSPPADIDDCTVILGGRGIEYWAGLCVGEGDWCAGARHLYINYYNDASDYGVIEAGPISGGSKTGAWIKPGTWESRGVQWELNPSDCETFIQRLKVNTRTYHRAGHSYDPTSGPNSNSFAERVLRESGIDIWLSPWPYVQVNYWD